MYNLINSAANNESNKSHTFFIDGDLLQMSEQKRFLQSRGFNVQQNNVYPCLRQEDVERALKLIWENRVEGWWHYEEKYVELGICTKEEFWARLNNSVKRNEGRI